MRSLIIFLGCLSSIKINHCLETEGDGGDEPHKALSLSISCQALVITFFSSSLDSCSIPSCFRMAQTFSMGQTSAILGACCSCGHREFKAEQASMAIAVLWIVQDHTATLLSVYKASLLLGGFGGHHLGIHGAIDTPAPSRRRYLLWNFHLVTFLLSHPLYALQTS